MLEPDLVCELIAANTLIRRTADIPDWSYLWYDVAEQTSLVFEVRACSDALIQLPEFHGINDYHTYQVHLGQFFRVSQARHDF